MVIAGHRQVKQQQSIMTHNHLYVKGDLIHKVILSSLNAVYYTFSDGEDISIMDFLRIRWQNC